MRSPFIREPFAVTANGVFRSLADVPAIGRSIAMTVTIPARDEESEIERALSALATQRGAPAFDVILLANNCKDETVDRAVRFAQDRPEFALHILALTLPDGTAHVGTARKMLMDAAVARLRSAGSERGIVATTDADTVVAPDWVARTCHEMEHADAVAGCVEIRSSDRAAMSGAMQALYARELRYRDATAELEALIDPVPEDPLPRHSSFVAASFAVTVEAYRRSGGLQALSALEDRVFLASLRRIDARVRHSTSVRAWTSGRLHSRVTGGFATFVNHLHRQAPGSASYDVADPRDTIGSLECRAALRRIWTGIGTLSDLNAVRAVLGIPDVPYSQFARISTFGLFYERVVASALDMRPRMLVPLERALDVMEAQVVARRAAAPGNA